MKKILSIIKYVLLAICVVSLIPIFLNGENGVDFILTWAAVLLGLAVVITLVLSAINLFNNPKGALRSLIGLGIMVLIIGVSWALASTDPVVTPVDVFTNRFELKLTDTGLYTTYVLLAAAILVAVFGEIRNSFK